MKMKLRSITLTNYKGQTITIRFDGKDVEIIGDNATGKTNIADAFFFLFCDRDSLGRTQYEIKSLMEDGEPVHGLEHSVEAELLVDDMPWLVKKTYCEKWTKRKGASQRLFEGHVLSYYVNGIARRKKDYMDTIHSFIPEDLLPVFISPTGFNDIGYQERRSLLLKICNEVTDGEIITLHPEFSLIHEILDGRSEEDTRSVIKGSLRAVNKALEKLPVRMDEVTRSLPEDLLPEDTALSLQNNLSSLKGEEDTLRKILEELRENETRRRLQQQLSAAREALALEETSASEARRRELADLFAKLQDAEDRHRQADAKVKEQQRRQAENRARTTKLQEETQELRLRWEETAGRTFQHSDTCTCPLCGQHIPQALRQEAREKALKSFEDDKQQALEAITQKGQEAARGLETLAAEGAALAEGLAPLEQEARDGEKNLLQLRRDYDTRRQHLSTPGDTPELARLRREVEGLQAQLQGQKEAEARQEADINRQLEEVTAQAAKYRGLLAHTAAAEAVRRRMEELKEEQRTLTDEYEKLESQLALLDAFTRCRMELLQDRINHHFTLARFRLFDTQVNGEIVECCDTLYQGVPYNTNLNHGHRIAVGMDIINTLSRHFNISMPLFIDNRESVSQLPPTNAQVISLVMSRGDRVLRYQPDHTILPLDTPAPVQVPGPGF